MSDATERVDNAFARQTDWGFRCLVMVSATIGVWLVLTPWVPSISDCLMRRFHLRTGSFVVWAIQQPIPPMYSCRNTTEVRDLPLDIAESGLLDPLLLDPLFGLPGVESKKSPALGVIGGRTINHFPTREITFANSRYEYFSKDRNANQSNRWFVFESTYRGRLLRSVYELQTEIDGVWRMKRIDE
jgi:hypothetical protein